MSKTPVRELKGSKEEGLQGLKDLSNNHNYDSGPEDRKPEKEEPMDDHDTEAETEAKGEENFEEESEDEDIILSDNTIQPGPFKNIDSIVCLATEPDKAMVSKYLVINPKSTRRVSQLKSIRGRGFITPSFCQFPLY